MYGRTKPWRRSNTPSPKSPKRGQIQIKNAKAPSHPETGLRKAAPFQPFSGSFWAEPPKGLKASTGHRVLYKDRLLARFSFSVSFHQPPPPGQRHRVLLLLLSLNELDSLGKHPNYDSALSLTLFLILFSLSFSISIFIPPSVSRHKPPEDTQTKHLETVWDYYHTPCRSQPSRWSRLPSPLPAL